MDKRFFLALFLSLIVIAVSQLLFPAPKPIPGSRGLPAGDSSSRLKNVESQATASSSLPNATQASTALATRVSPKPARAVAQSVAETTTVSTTKAIYRFANIGGAPVSITMRDYVNRSASGGLVDLAGEGSPLLEYRLVTPGDTIDLSKIPFVLSRARGAAGEEALTYDALVKNDTVSITYVISQDTSASYSIEVNGRVKRPSGQVYLLIDLPRTLRPAEADTTADYRTLAYSFKPQKDHARSVLFGSLEPGEKTLEPGPLSWAAVKSKYFVLGILSPPNGTPFSEVTLGGGARTSKVATNATATVVEAIKNNSFAFQIYAGPQESQRLARMGQDFDHVNPYGWRFLQGVVHPIASKVIQALLWMHNRLSLSYGWVLVILGILVRFALWPLNQSTMRSSLKMQELQPKLAAAQKKYPDPVQQREAIMKVYHDAGVSPFAGLTGCLPALLPMPILFALFFVFQNTIEFRGVPFMWLHDISIKDPLYILPLLMGASMYLLSWIGMRNAPPNPQAKMMGYMFPVMMTVVLLNMASGLNLYYTAQNIAALPQQWLLARERAKARPKGG
ncbi:MAG: membrane protein insertase YidC [Gemmatimonadota bacterium]|nr:membrane protein insertase YidC [Gemmatimonadota bacterium]